MSDQISAIIASITAPDGAYDAAAHKALFAFCMDVARVAEQGGTNLDAIIKAMKAGAGTRLVHKRILLESTLAEITRHPAWLRRLFDTAEDRGLSFDERHALFIHLSITLFRTRSRLDEAVHAELEQERLRTLMKRLVAEMDEALAPAAFAEGPVTPVPGRVVILTPQYIQVPHAQTMRTNEYAAELIRCGKSPIIVESHYPPIASPLPFVPPYVSNRNQRPGVDSVEIAGQAVPYHKVAGPYVTLGDLAHTLALVSALSPELVIAISTPFLAAEALARRFPVFSQPTAASPPLTVRTTSFSWNPLTPRQAAVLEKHGAAGTHAFDMHPGFSAPEPAPPVSRDDLDVDGDAFVFAVVGARLDQDVQPDFVAVMKRLLETPRAVILMMGAYAGFDGLIKANPELQGRVRFLGFRNDVVSVLAACDACLNPDRAGGGRSGAYAQMAGLPVLSLKRGDVASTIGPERCFDTYDEMLAEADRLMTDSSHHERRRDDARSRAAETIGVAALVDRIFEVMKR